MSRSRAIPVSHLTLSQAARYVGVAQPTVWERVHDAQALPYVTVLGVDMVAVDDCRRWRRERLKAGRRSPSTGASHDTP